MTRSASMTAVLVLTLAGCYRAHERGNPTDSGPNDAEEPRCLPASSPQAPFRTEVVIAMERFMAVTDVEDLRIGDSDWADGERLAVVVPHRPAGSVRERGRVLVVDLEAMDCPRVVRDVVVGAESGDFPPLYVQAGISISGSGQTVAVGFAWEDGPVGWAGLTRLHLLRQVTEWAPAAVELGPSLAPPGIIGQLAVTDRVALVLGMDTPSVLVPVDGSAEVRRFETGMSMTRPLFVDGDQFIVGFTHAAARHVGVGLFDDGRGVVAPAFTRELVVPPTTTGVWDFSLAASRDGRVLALGPRMSDRDLGTETWLTLVDGSTGEAIRVSPPVSIAPPADTHLGCVVLGHCAGLSRDGARVAWLSFDGGWYGSANVADRNASGGYDLVWSGVPPLPEGSGCSVDGVASIGVSAAGRIGLVVHGGCEDGARFAAAVVLEI